MAMEGGVFLNFSVLALSGCSFFRRVIITSDRTSTIAMRDVLMMVERVFIAGGGSIVPGKAHVWGLPLGIHRVTHQELKSRCVIAIAASSS